jgi:hypothetical protein
LTPSTTVTSGLGGGRDHDLLGAGIEVLGGILAVGEESGRFDHDLGAELAPRQRSRVALGADRDLLAVDLQTSGCRLDDAGERPVIGVVLEQVRDRLRIDQIVDPDPLDLRLALVRRAEDIAPDPAEAVDPHAYRHVMNLQVFFSAPVTQNTGPAPQKGPLQG